MIPFNCPYLSYNELSILEEVYTNRKFSGGGDFTDRSNALLEKLHKLSKSILTTSCTDALEMAALLFNIGPGDEVILPSYTFVSTALPFEMRGAKLIFADSEINRPHISLESIKSLITNKTKLIIVVNYGGTGCELEEIRNLCLQHNIYLLEDNAQGINSFLKGKALGTFGELSTLSFHETKNINCGEGGALIINDKSFYDRAVVLKDKGTNRESFNKGLVDKYSWTDIGSSYLLSEILAGHLYTQLLNLEEVTNKRVFLHSRYSESLACLKTQGILLPYVNSAVETNGHIFYIVCTSLQQRNEFLSFMRDKGISCVTHYVSLHSSPYFINKYEGQELKNSDYFSNCLVRLPMFYDLQLKKQDYIINNVKKFFGVN